MKMKSRPLPILLYHNIGTGESATPPNVFREHMQHLHKRAIAGISLTEFESVMTTGNFPDKPAVLITFDDGSRDCLTEALPVLTEFDFHATVFLITGRMQGSEGGLSPYGNALSWDEVRLLQDSGRIALQSHSHTHSRWQFDAAGYSQLSEELRQSRETLASELGGVGSRFCHLAWPWGNCSLMSEYIAKDLGYTYQYLVQKGALTHAGSTMRMPRLCCDGMQTATFVRWIDVLTSPFCAHAANRLYGAIRKWRHGLAYQWRY
jgi:peptidoglycan/xylan/chitin deacetylase (PgdA/CDA1 family)